MNVINIILFGILPFSFNIQFIIIVTGIIFFSSYCSRISSSRYIPYLLFFIIAFPSSAIGQTGILVSSVYFSFATLVFFTHSLIYKNNTPVKINKIGLFLIFSMLFGSVIVYLPIPLETYLSMDFSGPEEAFVSNARQSHMLSFVVPFIFAPIAMFVTARSFSYNIDLFVIYGLIKKLIVILLFLSMIRFMMNFDFISQAYSEVRFEGYRLTGFTMPDANGFARSLLFPLAFIASYIFAGVKNKQDFLILLLLLISIIMTMSRTAYVSSFVILCVIFLYNFKLSNLVKVLTIPFIIFTIVYISGLFDSVLLRIEGGANASLSGRGVIYGSVIQAIEHSPIVGLRPGGWMEYLAQGVTYERTSLKPQSTHSFYLETIINWGIPVFILFISSIIYSIFRSHQVIRLIKKNKSFYFVNLRIWLIVSNSLLIGLMVHGIVEIVPYHYFFFIIGLINGISYIIKNNNLSHIIQPT
jgi:O-antigen ligase